MVKIVERILDGKYSLVRRRCRGSANGTYDMLVKMIWGSSIYPLTLLSIDGSEKASSKIHESVAGQARLDVCTDALRMMPTAFWIDWASGSAVIVISIVLILCGGPW